MTLKESIREEVIARDKRICQYCGKGKLYKRQLHLDHVVPECLGGQFTPDNLIVACNQCNRRKSKKSQADYVADRIKQVKRELFYLEQLQK